MKEKGGVRRRGMARVVFLAHEAKFRALIEAGYPLLSIYQEHADELGIGYPQFTRYVNRYLLDAVLHQRKGATSARPPTATPRPPDPVPVSPAASGTKSSIPFQHNPDGGNNRDDLI